MAEKHQSATLESCAMYNEAIQPHQLGHQWSIDDETIRRDSFHSKKMRLEQQVSHITSEREEKVKYMEQQRLKLKKTDVKLGDLICRVSVVVSGLNRAVETELNIAVNFFCVDSLVKYCVRNFIQIYQENETLMAAIISPFVIKQLEDELSM